jgi:hypothetical protein
VRRRSPAERSRSPARDRLRRPPTPPASRSCYNCGKSDHVRRDCPRGRGRGDRRR